MAEFDKIYLAWCKGGGTRCNVVGLLEKQPNGEYTFQYLPEAKKLVATEGFMPYFEFQDFHKKYDKNVVAIFAQRLMKPQRPDVKVLYDFWEVDPALADDRFYMLGKTQGLVATDNFEFLADYHVNSETHFVTDLAGLSHTQLPKDAVAIGDVLHTQLEQDNERDADAVQVFSGDLLLGYIKKIHCQVFHKADADKLRLKVKDIEQNGLIRKIFVSVAHQDVNLGLV